MVKCMSNGGKTSKDIGSKKVTTKEIPLKGSVKLAAGGAAKQRRGLPMTKAPAAPKKK